METNKIHNQDCLEGMRELDDDSVDLIVTDPPYGLEFMGKDWDKAVPDTEVWEECLRVLKAGAFAFVMSSPRLDCLSEMVQRLKKAGFDISFSPIYWTYASGFPKAANIGKLVDARFGAEREVIGKNPSSRPKSKRKNAGGFDSIKGMDESAGIQDITASATPQAKALDGSYAGFQPKPAVEVIIVAMKPLSENTYTDQALKNGKGVTWLDRCRIPHDEDLAIERDGHKLDTNEQGWGFKAVSRGNEGRFPANLLVCDDALNDGNITTSEGGDQRLRNPGGFNNCDKVNPNAPTGYGDTGSFSRYFSLDAWWRGLVQKLPPEVQKVFPFLIVPKASKGEKNAGLEKILPKYLDPSREAGSPGGTNPRNRGAEKKRKNFHPTVKPLKLFSYLITLGSRPGDLILDPFIGSGTAGIAATLTDRDFIGFELTEEYCKIANARLEFWEKPEFKREAIREAQKIKRKVEKMRGQGRLHNFFKTEREGDED